MQKTNKQTKTHKNKTQTKPKWEIQSSCTESQLEPGAVGLSWLFLAVSALFPPVVKCMGKILWKAVVFPNEQSLGRLHSGNAWVYVNQSQEWLAEAATPTKSGC